jgi:DNA-cytosine methyltransferase
MPSLWVLEDGAGLTVRRDGTDADDSIPLRLLRVHEGEVEAVGETRYTPGSLGRGERADLAIKLIRNARIDAGPLVTDARFGTNSEFINALSASSVEFVVSLRHDTRLGTESGAGKSWAPQERLAAADWIDIQVKAPGAASAYKAAELGPASFAGLESLHCFAYAAGGILQFRRGVVVGAASTKRPLEELVSLLGWSRWVQPASRKRTRTANNKRNGSGGEKSLRPAVVKTVVDLQVRSNLKTARRLDETAASTQEQAAAFCPRRILTGERQFLNVLELFAGAGGMGLGFLMAGLGRREGYRLVFSGEIHPIYTQSLQDNHEFLHANDIIPRDRLPADTQARDLRHPDALAAAAAAVEAAGGVDVLIGGPPCQGFSPSNRNSHSSSNPNNRLVDTFVDYVVRLRPRVFLMENVQGILWTPRPEDHDAELSVAEHVAQRLGDAGYRVYPKLLDAAWYGVPQFRSRFFLMGIHEDLGYAPDAFGAWGPFPMRTHGPGTTRRYVTVHDAVGNLPVIGNGFSDAEIAYEPVEPADPVERTFFDKIRRFASGRLIRDHVTSRHADYVIERYRKIQPGGNWEDIKDMMTNYADLDRTHSNIYRRLKNDEPSITIGHYRKSMIIHPAQHRGLSLREASRLQSFPDWFRFAGSTNGARGGLMHKQQQLANAVCPLVTEAVAGFIVDL